MPCKLLYQIVRVGQRLGLGAALDRVSQSGGTSPSGINDTDWVILGNKPEPPEARWPLNSVTMRSR
jgi:hypothetical protein